MRVRPRPLCAGCVLLANPHRAVIGDQTCISVRWSRCRVSALIGGAKLGLQLRDARAQLCNDHADSTRSAFRERADAPIDPCTRCWPRGLRARCAAVLLQLPQLAHVLVGDGGARHQRLEICSRARDFTRSRRVDDRLCRPRSRSCAEGRDQFRTESGKRQTQNAGMTGWPRSSGRCLIERSEEIIFG